MNDALPNDIYVDGTGKLWRVFAVFREPCVIVREVEHEPGNEPTERMGGVSGYMWHDHKRIYRHCDHDWEGELDPRGGIAGACKKCGAKRHVP